MAVSSPRTGARRPARRPGQLAGGRHGLTADQVRASQRARLLDAMTAAVGEHGYPDVRVADVVARAGVSRKTFYDLFAGKNDCFAATYEHWIGRLLEPAFAAFAAEAEWVDGLRAALAALLAGLAREPAAARVCFGDAVAAGGPAQDARERAAARLAATLFDAPTAPAGAVGDTLRAGRASELGELLRREIAAGRTERLPELLPDLMCAMVLPFLGIEAAQRELDRGGGRGR